MIGGGHKGTRQTRQVLKGGKSKCSRGFHSGWLARPPGQDGAEYRREASTPAHSPSPLGSVRALAREWAALDVDAPGVRTAVPK